MNSTIHLIGINHRTAAVEVREKFALTNFCAPDTWAIPTGDGISESLILSKKTGKSICRYISLKQCRKKNAYKEIGTRSSHISPQIFQKAEEKIGVRVTAWARLKPVETEKFLLSPKKMYQQPCQGPAENAGDQPDSQGLAPQGRAVKH